METQERIRTVLADSFPILRQGVAVILEGTGRFRVVAHADSMADALSFVEKEKPHLFITDASLDGKPVFPFIPEIQKQGARSLILANECHHGHACRALENGASGYVLKTDGTDILLDAAGTVARGGVFVSPSLPGLLRESILAAREGAREGAGLEILTARELQVLDFLARGWTGHQIADTMGINAKTVLRHRANIMGKFYIHDPLDLMEFARRNTGGLEAPSPERDREGK